MSYRRRGRDLWREVAAVVIDEVAERMRTQGQQGARYGEGKPHSAAQVNPAVSPTPTPPPSQPAPQFGDERAGPGASIVHDLRGLVSEGLRTGASSLADYRAERERRRVEAPMRRMRSRAGAEKAGSIALGTLGVIMLAGGAGSIAKGNPAPAVPAVVLSAGAGAGAVAMNRRSKSFAAQADAYARQLGAPSATSVVAQGPAAYSVTLPPSSSRAYQPAKRLAGQKAALAQLLPDVEQLAPELAPLAAEAEAMLESYAQRIMKLERAQAASGSTSLDEPLDRAVAQYEDGVRSHQKLVEAAATVMAELQTPSVPAQAHTSMLEAADRLRGLADGLREVRHDIPVNGWGASTGKQATSTTDEGAGQPGGSHPSPRPSKAHDRRRGIAT